MMQLFYLPRDSYLITHPDAISHTHLYADGATSGIVLVAVGADAEHRPLVAMAHLTGTLRFRALFSHLEHNFCGSVTLHVYGANGSASEHANYDALMNSDCLLSWVCEHTHYPGKALLAPHFYLSQCTLSLGTAPAGETSCISICIDPNASDFLTVSTQPLPLDANARDSTGVFTLCSLFGIKTMHPSLSLPRADHVFSKEETDMLVWEARRSRWTELLNLDDFALRKRYCIGGEADWYLDLLRQSARFVHDYGETADGIGRRAIEF